jgi:2-amino-4-hydroxy-6-hydroxymethyldihydropteridine diphosphokinase
MNRVFIALGSNIEPRINYLHQALERLELIGNVKQVSPVYKSNAYGLKDQPDFYNCACILETDLSPLELLQKNKNFELSIGRIRRRRWGPREIDIDIIFFDDKVIHNEDFSIPHYDYENRKFVIQPIADMDSNLIVPDTKKSILKVLEECKDDTKLELVETDWVESWN